MHSRRELSFFLINKTGTLAEDGEERIYPRISWSSRYSQRVFSSAADMP